MLTLAADFLPLFFLIALGAVLGTTGFFSVEMVEGLKRIVASVALPAVLFGAFSRVDVDSRLGLLALGIFVACGLMGLIGHLASRATRLPDPATRFLFQGFEAGMLGYGLFIALFGKESVSFFATADLGQVVFVFTVLMTQLRRAESGGPIRPLTLLRNMLLSPVIIAIIAGLLASVTFPGAVGSPWSEDAFLTPALTTIASLTTPLVCLVVGFGLKDFRLQGAGQALILVLLRLGTAIVVGSLLTFVMVSALGFPKLQSVAVLFLFILPPPFVIPVFRTAKNDAAFISGVLSVHTLVSIIATVVLAAVART
jgi:malate permease and related proteins